MYPSLNKRFWSSVSVLPHGGQFAIHLDDRPIKTPSKADFLVPTEKLADLIAAEWQAQVDQVDPATMPMTRRANAAIDKVSVQKDAVAQMLAAYGGSDLLCYRADHPVELQARQAVAWDPLLLWAADTFSAPLDVTIGIMPVSQSESSLRCLSEPVENLPSFPLSGFHDLVTLSGSLVIGLAAINRHLPIENLWLLSRVDELWQEELWGVDDIATAEAEQKRQDFMDANAFFWASH